MKDSCLALTKRLLILVPASTLFIIFVSNIGRVHPKMEALKQKLGTFNWSGGNEDILKRHLYPSSYQIIGIKDPERNGNPPGISCTKKEKMLGRGESVSWEEILHISNRKLGLLGGWQWWSTVGRTMLEWDFLEVCLLGPLYKLQSQMGGGHWISLYTFPMLLHWINLLFCFPPWKIYTNKWVSEWMNL